jgi:hypothetical protein
VTNELNQRRRALAFNAVGPAVNEADCWLPLSARKAVADAVLAAVDADTGYCSHCGRGDAGPTAEEHEELRQRVVRSEAEVARLSTILRLLPTSAATLRGQIVEAICTWADHTSSDAGAAADAVIAVMARHAALEPKETP